MNIVELCAFCNLLFFYHICMSDEFAVGHLSATYKARCYARWKGNEEPSCSHMNPSVCNCFP